MLCTDAKVAELAKDARYLAKRERVRLVKCALVGNLCSKIHIVPVAIHPGFCEAPRPYDVDFTHYVRLSCTPGIALFDLEECMIHLENYPRDSTTSAFQWTIFRAWHNDERENKLIQMFSGGEDVDIVGSVLVVKSNSLGVACDVTASEIYFIERLLVDTLRCDPASESDLTDSDESEL